MTLRLQILSFGVLYSPSLDSNLQIVDGGSYPYLDEDLKTNLRSLLI